MLSHVVQGGGRDRGGYWLLWLWRCRQGLKHNCDPHCCPTINPPSVYMMFKYIQYSFKTLMSFLNLIIRFNGDRQEVWYRAGENVESLFRCNSVRSQWYHLRWWITVSDNNREHTHYKHRLQPPLPLPILLLLLLTYFFSFTSLQN